ncbi:hypothetical protein I4F81_002493 [Pyropia yezoensis]|uniref:Uncharacterized protein n=1 Tax=Pyropia yezoensis TaxID=2788 RepID=A0ACC3BQ88_PYRYE|nr:hypothetical protein I4F81_002493 [Neopyropia yezoensis]
MKGLVPQKRCRTNPAASYGITRELPECELNVVRRRLHDVQAVPVQADGSSASRGGKRPRRRADAAAAKTRPKRQLLVDSSRPLEVLLHNLGELRQDAHRRPPDWRVVLPAHPSSFDAVVDRPILRADVLTACRLSMPGEGQGDDRTRLVSVPASSGSGKTFLLQDVARHADKHFAECGFDRQLASWASSVVVFAVNFNSHFLVSDLEVKLIKKGKLKLKHLTVLRLVFLELADLTSARSLFQKFLVAVKKELNAGHCTRQQIELEARSLLQCRGGRAAHNAPVILLVDEVSKLTTLKAGGDLAKWRVAKEKSASVHDAVTRITSDLLAAAYELTDKADGVTFVSSLDYMTASRAATISGRSVDVVSDLYCSEPEQLWCIIYEGLRKLTSNGYMITRDAADCGEHYYNIRTDLFIARDAGAQPVLSDRTKARLDADARALSYLSGGHMRTAVELANWLAQAGGLVMAGRPHVSVKLLLKAIKGVASTTMAQNTWGMAAAADIDSVLSVVLLNLPVQGHQEVFRETRATASPVTATKIPAVWDEARYQSVVQGAGEDFRPRMPPLSLHQVMQLDGAKSCLLYLPLTALLRQVDTTADQRWEQAGCDLEWLQSCCRSLHPTEFKDITLAQLLNVNKTAYAGHGPLLRTVRVDASHARTGCTDSNLQLLLAQAERQGDSILLDQVHRLRNNAESLDAVWFFRVVGGRGAGALVGKVIMVGVQFKFSHATCTGLYPGTIYKDWDNLHKLLGKHYDKWVDRFVYLDYADRKVSSFPNGLTKRRHGQAIPNHCAEHSVVRGRKDLEACVGATAYHFIRSMHWLYRCHVTGPL